MKPATGKIIFCLLFIMSFMACSTPTERELYEDELDKTSYKSYKSLSSIGVSAAVTGFNTSVDDSSQINIDYSRLLLSYAWCVGQKPVFSFAESNQVLENSKDSVTKGLAHMMLSIGMFEKGWKQIAKEESDLGIAAMAKQEDQTQVRNEILIMHLLAGTLAIYERNFDMARVHFAGISQLTGIEWPYMLVDAMGDIDAGKIQQGLVKLKKASKDEKVPPEIRTALTDLIAQVEKKAGNVESSAFMPRLIGSMLLDELKNSGPEETKSLFSLPDKMKDKVSLF
jgi:hypothetical protein